MALQVDTWNGKVVTMEMDPVNACRLNTKHVPSMSRLLAWPRSREDRMPKQFNPSKSWGTEI